jgi:hypothetical protein
MRSPNSGRCSRSSSIQLDNQLSSIPGVKMVCQSASKVDRSEFCKTTPCKGTSRTHYRAPQDGDEASADRRRNATPCLRVGPTHKASRIYTTRMTKRRTDDKADLVIVSIKCRLEFFLCVLHSFRDIKIVEINRAFRKSLPVARQRLSMILAPRWMATYLVILTEEDFGCPLIQTLPFALVGDSVLSVSLFGPVITAPLRALGQVERRAHLTTAASCFVPQFCSNFLHAFVVRSRLKPDAIQGIRHDARRVQNAPGG